jgi:hypothetical protein
MSETLAFDNLLQRFHRQLEQLPDHRRGNNTTYEIKDAALGAFAVFYTQSPSFLAYQRTMKRRKGRSNAESLFGIEQIPCDNQIRTLLDPMAPYHLFPMFSAILGSLAESGELDPFRVLGGHLLVSLDGTRYFSSKKIHCPNCSHRTLPDDSVLYFHDVITPVIVRPHSAQVISLEPEFMSPQDGTDKQDCELTAAKRWIRRNSKLCKVTQVTVLGDDLYSNQPFCELLLEQGFSFVLVCKPESHLTLYDWLDFLEGDIQQVCIRRWNGQFAELWRYRYVGHVPLRDGKDALFVNWCEVTIVRESDGERLYRNSFVSNHTIDQTNFESIVAVGRARWKSENENNNILKTKGYHLEHNYGHGQAYLSSFLLTLNLLAFLFHTVFELADSKYQRLREALAARRTFFNDIRALTRYLLFKSWDDLLDFMIKQLELAPDPVDTS